MVFVGNKNSRFLVLYAGWHYKESEEKFENEGKKNIFSSLIFGFLFIRAPEKHL